MVVAIIGDEFGVNRIIDDTEDLSWIYGNHNTWKVFPMVFDVWLFTSVIIPRFIDEGKSQRRK